jgi:transcriptional regulator with XRE-family HTH domain
METNVNPDTAGGLRERRLATGLTQQQLANLADCSLTHLQLLERGYSPTRSEVRARVLAALRQYEATS